MTRAVLLTILLVAACSQPRAAVNIDATSSGTTVTPVVSGSLGIFNVRVRP